MIFKLDPSQAAFLVERSVRLAGSARELSAFGEAEPHLASECGVEINALEARTILASGAVDRVARAAAEAVQTRRHASLAAEDLEAVARLEGTVALGSSRIGLKLATLEAAARQEPSQQVNNLIAMGSGVIGLGSGVIGLAKSLGIF